MTSFSRSEQAGIDTLPIETKTIYSVGISTGGTAEIAMAKMAPESQVIATTLDERGIEFSKQVIAREGLANRIEAKIEDIASQLPYAEASFEYIYARLVLHYLTKQDLSVALASLHRVLAPEKLCFVVVRSTKCPDALKQDSTYDPVTGLTRYIGGDGRICFRQFHTQESIGLALSQAGFAIQSVEQYDEQLFIDYARTQIAPHTDNVIEVIARKS